MNEQNTHSKSSGVHLLIRNRCRKIKNNKFKQLRVLKQKLDKARSECKKATSEYKKSDEMLSKNNLKRLHDENLELRKLMEYFLEFLESAEIEYNDMKNKLKKLEMEKNFFENQNKELRSRSEPGPSFFDIVRQRRIKDLESQINSLETELTDSKTINQNQQTQSEMTKEELSRLKDSNESLSKQIKGQTKVEKKLKEIIEQKTSNYANSQQRFNDLHKTYLDLVFDHQKLEREYKELKANQLSNNNDNNE